MNMERERSGFEILIRAHDYVWNIPCLPLKERIQVCTVLWNLAISICLTEEKPHGNYRQ